jgi:hypothetical protein
VLPLLTYSWFSPAVLEWDHVNVVVQLQYVAVLVFGHTHKASRRDNAPFVGWYRTPAHINEATTNGGRREKMGGGGTSPNDEHLASRHRTVTHEHAAAVAAAAHLQERCHERVVGPSGFFSLHSPGNGAGLLLLLLVDVDSVAQ